MGNGKSYEELKEKSLEVILNFKPSDNFDKAASEEILKLKEEIKKAISTLPDKHKEILELRYFKNLTDEQIAQKIGSSKEEVLKVILSSLDNIKKNIKTNRMKKKEVVTSQTYNRNIINQSPETSLKRDSSFLIGFLGTIFFIGFTALSFILLQKFLFPNLSKISEFISQSSFTVQNSFPENISKDKKNKVIDENTNNIRISGSTSLLILSKRWQNAFNSDYPKYNISLISSDSDSGIKSLINGKTNIANSSRPLTFFDQQRASENSVELAEYRVALDALIIIVNKNNPISEISLDNLTNIFNGKIKNWQILGGKNQVIVPIAREKGSGTNDFVINRILQGEDFSTNTLIKNSNKGIRELISENEGAIGFVNSTNYPWSDINIKYLKVKNFEDSPSVSPFENKKLNENAIRYGDYPLAHYLYLITISDPPEKVQKFVDWILGSKGQAIVRYSGLIPVFK